ncbi:MULTISPECIES: TetR/AcrR family transcriptional regulator [unclassified Hydrogenophaga]|jgi:AcrR family transcriptional regulator|uniref:TetR/AcrR family transcriptional regulator n=1 Tax=unclassified Hydrogenophaga TaxID=2610897 RepID=UPI0009A2BC33|nr:MULTISPECIES: TetR/AcrR family transcriptional regulator [unclassified Hydrogenophaga]OPF62914.1 TetR family transcriptional regulator [Hydrogenophaga sp. H7]
MVTGSTPARSKPATTRGAARPDRQHAILLAAEKLFAQHGYHGVTIRQIAEEAGVPLALVGYYYGPKHELFHAIFAHWNQTIEERLTALDAASGDPGDPDTLNRIIEAFVRPVIRLRHSEEGFYYAQLVGRELAYGSAEADRVLREFFDPLAHRFIEALRTVFQTASLADVAWAYQFALGALLHHLVDDRVHRLSQGQSLAGDPAAADRLVRFIVGGLRAALPAPPVPAPPKTAPPSRRRHT